MTAVDLLIEHGTVVDGTGAPGLSGTIGITDGRLRVWHGPAPEETRAARRIDATGNVVAPGFIDLHSHGGLVILAEPRHEPKVRQGVTTELIGVDGNSYAPFPDPGDLADFRTLNAGLDGCPDVGYDWSTTQQLLARYNGRVAVNIAFIAGNTPLRIAAVGWEETPADERAISDQRAMLRESMEEGAFGLSTGLDYPPGAYATTEELGALAAEAARNGGIYHTHVRYPLGDGFLDPFREAIQIGRLGDCPVHITHFYHRSTFPGTPEQMLALVDDARAEGLDVTFDLYPSEWSSTRLLIMLPTWIQAGGVDRLRERLADRVVRERIRAEMRARGRLFAGERGLHDVRLGHFARPEHQRWEGRTLGELVEETGADPVDAVCDLLLSEDLRVNQVTPGPHRAGTMRFLQHPVAMIGTDAVLIGDKPAPRTYGSFPRVLGEFVREERLLSLEAAVHRMTGMAADRLGLRERGRLADGLAADVVVFDPARVRSLATWDEPKQFPVGIPYVIVNGVPVVDGGEHTGATPGRALRRGAG